MLSFICDRCAALPDVSYSYGLPPGWRFLTNTEFGDFHLCAECAAHFKRVEQRYSRSLRAFLRVPG